MKILNAQETRMADAFTIENKPITSIDLMEYASRQCSKWILDHFFDNNNSSFIIIAGPGNNGGDGLAIARHLAACYLKVCVVLLSEKLSPDAEINYNRIKEIPTIEIILLNSIDDFPKYNNEFIIDALFGSGLSRKLEGLAAQLVQHINQLKATIISIDIPSGLFDEINTTNNSSNRNTTVVNASHTLTFENPYLSFFFAENEFFIGQWVVLPIGLDSNFISQTASTKYMLTKAMVNKILKKRGKFSHKGTYGHSLLVSGSLGKIGATVLAAKACIRSGTGLLTVHVPKCGYSILQSTVAEAMVINDTNKHHISGCAYPLTYNAIGIGPGIGQHTETENALSFFIRNYKKPMVIDADALNIISKQKSLLQQLPVKSIITPHPKEFERIAGKYSNSYEALKKQIALAKKHQLIVVLKGAHTSIAFPDGSVFFNTTGNPGMATAGSGDVLTGIILSLLSQNYSPENAALIGVFVHGYAGDIVVKNSSEAALIASDLTTFLGQAFYEIENY